MTKVLYIEASPGQDSSVSSTLANSFLETYREKNPDHEIEHLPLFEVDLPNFGQEGARQKFENLGAVMTGQGPIEAQGEWAGVMTEIDRLKSASKVLLSAPMWNFSIPWRLKQWIDVIAHIGETVHLEPKDGGVDYVGQITGRPLQMILASGSPYEMRFPLESDEKVDFQRAYLDNIFRFIGFTDIRLVKAQPTGVPDGPQREALHAEWEKMAKEAARQF